MKRCYYCGRFIGATHLNTHNVLWCDWNCYGKKREKIIKEKENEKSRLDPPRRKVN